MRIYSLTNDRFGQAKRFASKFGCPTEDSTELVACLKKVDGRELVAKHEDARVQFCKAVVKNYYAFYIIF